MVAAVEHRVNRILANEIRAALNRGFSMREMRSRGYTDKTIEVIAREEGYWFDIESEKWRRPDDVADRPTPSATELVDDDTAATAGDADAGVPEAPAEAAEVASQVRDLESEPLTGDEFAELRAGRANDPSIRVFDLTALTVHPDRGIADEARRIDADVRALRERVARWDSQSELRAEADRIDDEIAVLDGRRAEIEAILAGKAAPAQPDPAPEVETVPAWTIKAGMPLPKREPDPAGAREILARPERLLRHFGYTAEQIRDWHGTSGMPIADRGRLSLTHVDVFLRSCGLDPNEVG